jgi:hypothetical protein
VTPLIHPSYLSFLSITAFHHKSSSTLIHPHHRSSTPLLCLKRETVQTTSSSYTQSVSRSINQPTSLHSLPITHPFVVVVVAPAGTALSSTPALFLLAQTTNPNTALTPHATALKNANACTALHCPQPPLKNRQRHPPPHSNTLSYQSCRMPNMANHAAARRRSTTQWISDEVFGTIQMRESVRDIAAMMTLKIRRSNGGELAVGEDEEAL